MKIITLNELKEDLVNIIKKISAGGESITVESEPNDVIIRIPYCIEKAPLPVKQASYIHIAIPSSTDVEEIAAIRGTVAMLVNQVFAPNHEMVYIITLLDDAKHFAGLRQVSCDYIWFPNDVVKDINTKVTDNYDMSHETPIIGVGYRGEI